MNKEKLKDAYAILAGIPAVKFCPGLMIYDNQTANQRPNPKRCGTLACGIGWLAMHPDFVKPHHLRGPLSDRLWDVENALDIDDNSNLFGPRGESLYDHELPLCDAITDKELLLYRLRRVIYSRRDRKAAFAAAREDAA